MSIPLSLDQAAERMNVGKRTVERLIAEGELASIKVRGRRFVLEEVVERYLTGPATRRGRVA